MSAVSNTSPIWNLASLNRLNLLHDQFSYVSIPQEVLKESSIGHEYPEMERIQKAIDSKIIIIKPLTQVSLKKSFLMTLDAGEAAAIALAIESRSRRILIDEAEGRSVARAMGLKPTGVLGILLRAKQEGIIISLTREMDRLRHEAGFFGIDQAGVTILSKLLTICVGIAIGIGVVVDIVIGISIGIAIEIEIENKWLDIPQDRNLVKRISDQCRQ